MAILDAQYKAFDLPPEATSYSIGMEVPTTAGRSEPAAIVRRGEVASGELARRLVADARRVFADAGAIAR